LFWFANDLPDQGLNDHYRALKPSDCFGAYTDDVDPRFRDMDKSFKDKLIDAMRWEDTQLRKHVDKHRLEQWATTTIKLAEDTINRIADQATEDGAAIANGVNGTTNGNGSVKA